MKSTLTIGAIALLTTLAGLPAAEPPKPRHGGKLIVVNDDGFSQFHTGRYRTAADLRQRMLDLRDTQVGVMEWCIVAGSRVNYPSQLHELIGAGMAEYPRRGDKLASETLRRLANEGVDTLQVVADSCHEAGIVCYASLRMNGDYHLKGWDGAMPRLFNSRFWWEHPEFRLRSAKGEDQTKLSYAFPEVRDFKLGFLREAAERDIDGINLDFLRHPNYFGFEKPMVTAFQARHGGNALAVAADDPRWAPLRAELMTVFVRDVRRLLDDAGRRKGRHLGLSVRVDWQKYRTWGCDLATWLREGLLDYLVISQYGLGGYEFELAPFVKMARGTGCAVLFGEEGVTSGHDTTAAEDKLIAAGKMAPPQRGQLSLEQHQTRAARWYAAGADGVHLFNVSDLEVMRSLGSASPGK
jgi:hypothetical protein